jgi:hypothetical protein
MILWWLLRAECHGFVFDVLAGKAEPTHRLTKHSTKHNGRLYATLPIQGLVKDFDIKQTTHQTLNHLRQQVPLLLYQGYTDETASQAYTVDTMVVVGDQEDYVLASSREEMVSLQNAIFLAVQAPLRATNILSGQSLTAPIVRCRFVVPCRNISQVNVDWEVQATTTTKISGMSQLQLHDGKVCRHSLLQVSWNGRKQNAEAVGNALSRVRRTVRSLPQAQGGDDLPWSSLLEQYRDDLLRSLEVKLPSRDITASLQFDTEEVSSGNTNTSNDDSLPLPGTKSWDIYARTHVAIEHFVHDIIPQLASVPSLPIDEDAIFVPDAQLIGLDGTVLLPNGSRLAKYFKSLAQWRRRSGTLAWTLTQAKVLEWKDTPVVQISFVMEVAPASMMSLDGDTSIMGTDRYTLMVDSSSGALRIQQVEQEALSIGGNSKRQDLVLFMRGLVAAVENDRFVNADDEWIMDLWKRMRSNSNDLRKGEAMSKESLAKLSAIPTRSDSAAMTVYRIMTALHNDGKALVDPSVRRQVPPALDFMIENIQCRGLLNEVLSRGKSMYQRNLGFAIDSLQSALRAQRLSSVKEPKTTVELTDRGNIRYSLTLFLKVEPLTGLPNLLNIPRAGLTLTIDLISEYILDADSGRIVQHRLVESRINGQLTPGDVLSRIFLREKSDTGDWGRSFSDVLGQLANTLSS